MFEQRYLLLLAGALCGYALMIFTCPIRASLRDGLRCIQRYGTLWWLPALFGFSYALFELAVRVFFHFALPDGQKPAFHLQRAWFFPTEWKLEVARESVLPTVEAVAGLFNAVVTTYPFSAIAAVLLLFNYEGHFTVLRRALRKRFGRWSLLLFGGIALCAVAAIVKPLLYPTLVFLRNHDSALLLVQTSLVIDWLSFLFEYLFGVCIQIYLILLVFAWVRGLTFTHRHLLDVAIRRFSFVAKWAAVVMVASTLAIHLPLILSHIEPMSHWLPPSVVLPYIDRWARPVLALLLILFGAVQITLTFHSESLRKALRDHFELLREHWWPLAWFLLIAGIHFYVMVVLRAGMLRGLGEGTAPGIAWALLYPLLMAIVAAWMLATWVCLYKRCDTAAPRAAKWIPF